ncbi:MAG: squalene/phytoene synthase family protein, partial [Geminicoccaceae bacterium]|nr:squalene/phytoene synthase family protein [Geminicoccaceae bacterium]
MAFYRFVRAADDIADNPGLGADQKLARLDVFRRALDGAAGGDDFVNARMLRASLRATGVTAEYAHDLLRAFMQDAVKQRYDDWPDLLGYCRLSASPVGRFLLDLHGEDRALWRFSDPLCDALQVLNHLQDCQADYRRLDRVYLPLDAFEAAGTTVEALDRPVAEPPVRRVLDDVLARTADLLERADP